VLAVRERQLPAATWRGQHGQRVPQAHEGLQDGLLPLPQPKVPLVEDLHAVVDQADAAHRHDRCRSSDAESARDVTSDDQRDGEGREQRQRSHDTTHGRRSGLLGVVLHLVVDGLTDALPTQQSDQDWGEQHRERE
jgi:hypothetical protein